MRVQTTPVDSAAVFFVDSAEETLIARHKISPAISMRPQHYAIAIDDLISDDAPRVTEQRGPGYRCRLYPGIR